MAVWAGGAPGLTFPRNALKTTIPYVATAATKAVR